MVVKEFTAGLHIEWGAQTHKSFLKVKYFVNSIGKSCQRFQLEINLLSVLMFTLRCLFVVKSSLSRSLQVFLFFYFWVVVGGGNREKEKKD